MMKTERAYWYRSAISGMVTMWVLIALMVGIGTLGGCADVRKAAEQTIEQLTPIVDGATQAVSDLQGAIDRLEPGDPVRVALESKLAKTKEVLDKASSKIKLAEAALSSVEKGEIDPSLYAALGAIPYGTYIGLALSVGLAFYKSGQAGKFKDATTKIVQAWQQVGAELTPDQKAQARAIQGEKVTAIVHDIKGEEVTPLG
jgi:hypothetical protein